MADAGAGIDARGCRRRGHRFDRAKRWICSRHRPGRGRQRRGVRLVVPLVVPLAALHSVATGGIDFLPGQGMELIESWDQRLGVVLQ